MNSESYLNITPTMQESGSAFSTKQSRSRSLKKADEHLPNSPRKKVEIIKNLASKYQIRIKMNEKRGRPRKELNDDKKAWLIDFLGRNDITYTNPGRADNVYIGKVEGERKYMPRQYLLWTLRDLLEIINGTHELVLQSCSNFVSSFSEKLTFSQLYDFIKTHKQFIYNKNIPHASCLCDTCKNAVLLAKGLNRKKNISCKVSETPHDIVEDYSCSSDEKDCMFNCCSNCKDGKLCDISTANSSDLESDNSSSESDTDSDEFSVYFYKWESVDKHTSKVRVSVPFDEAVERFKDTIISLKKHIYSKRAQNRIYNRVKENLDHGEVLVHVDYAESYKNSQQNEMQSAYFGNSVFSIFTACCYSRSPDGSLKKDSIVVISESKDHDRKASLT